MKMETVIRSPQDGVIKRLAHKEGVSIYFRSRQFKPDTNPLFLQDICKAGTVLVMFEETEAEESKE